jgi:hypothetical protein
MFVEYMRIQGYKSLRDVELRDLASVNVFHGANDVGKSNILQALDMFFQILPVAVQSASGQEDQEGRAQAHVLLPYRFLQPYSETIFRQNGDGRIAWLARLRLPQVDKVVTVGLTIVNAPGGLRLELIWPDGEPEDQVKQLLSDYANDFTLVAAERRLAREWLGDETQPVEFAPRERHGSPVEPARLKQMLFEAVNHRDMSQRQRFKRMTQLLDEAFGVGQLDVTWDSPREVERRRPDEPLRYVRDIQLRFFRPDLPEGLPIEDSGSGVQQVVLMLGQIIFNPGRLVGIEEPEMNLNARWQDRLHSLLRGLVAPDGVDQLFISSHSSRFEFRDNFYRVDYVNSETVVEAKGREALAEVTGDVLPRPGEDMRQRLNSENQITLYDEVIRDLGLKYGDMVVFVKNQAGRWELEREDETLATLKEALDENGPA